MQEVLTVTAVKAREQSWARLNGGSTWPLMQQAGEAVARCAITYWPGLKRVWVLAGRGNNGGDGYVAAKVLGESGIDVIVLAPAGVPRAANDAAQAYQQFLDSRGLVQTSQPEGEADLLIDAFVGTGHQGEFEPSLSLLLQQMQTRCKATLAVDMPSGLNASTGVASKGALKADRTLTFIAHKPGQHTGQGPDYCGMLQLDTLGVPTGDAEPEDHQPIGFLQEKAASWPVRGGQAHKGSYGTVRVVAGAEGLGGAGLLAARAALHSGAGRVFWHTVVGHRLAAMATQPELMGADIEAPLCDPEAIYVIGPGLGQSIMAQHHYEAAANGFGGVLDADALTWLASQTAQLRGWVLTPHPGEAARLLGCSVAEIQADRCTAALAISQNYAATTVLKGAGTLVADQGKLVFVHPGTPAQSTPGMGDALAGMIAALMAQGYKPMQAAIAGADRHARLAAERARRQHLVLATDIIDDLRIRSS